MNSAAGLTDWRRIYLVERGGWCWLAILYLSTGCSRKVRSEGQDIESWLTASVVRRKCRCHLWSEMAQGNEAF